MEKLKSNEKRAKNVVLLIWLVLALEILSLISGYFQYELLQSVANGGSISVEKANANDIREMTIAIAYLVAHTISAVMFIMWFRRAYYNLHQKIDYLSYSESWAAGCWFVPIVNLYRPFQIMKEIYEETKELIIKKGVKMEVPITTSLLGWWWALWIINGISSQFVFRYSMKAETIEELTVTSVAGMICNIIGIPLALITIKVIRNYSEIEPLLNDVKSNAPTTTENISQ